jgi:hypothetical protein
MKTSMTRVFPATLLVLALAACSESANPPVEKAAAPAIQARGHAAAIEVTVTVEAVDVAKRLIKLKSADGNVAEYHVGDTVKRLAEIKVGDTIRGTYYCDMVAEFREPNAAEKADPIAFGEAVGRAPKSEAPQGAIARALRVVTKVDAIDAGAGTLTVKGPLGNRLTAEVIDKAALPTLKIGQPIIVTFSEALMLTVEPGEKK